MDKLYLKDVEIFANHGVFKEEKTLGQKFILTLELDLDVREAAKNCDLTKSVHYGELCHNIEKEFQRESYDLIETAAEKIAEYVLYNYDLVQGVKVLLKKPWAPIGRHLDTAAIEIYRKWHKAYISIGSNIGNKEENIKDSIERLKENKEIKVTKIASIIETEPWGYEEQDTFKNTAIEIKTFLNPKELMKTLLTIEQDMKRERIIKWGPRIIDLDIIFFDDYATSDDYVTIPHPRMEEREFVLEPLNEIAPNYIHPLNKKRVFRMLEEIRNK
ncbi:MULTISPECIES: 2-amino-4-hydroxy-6-hydroxymethyldihydropteridine diphosphokinase [unclassified Clostridium]|uniref:2-amino-4-hydroxy-6- hydroxymethyldihydropteridine diphosphokinase n=1 Tax=unclassified Clostridium TaxID=2614128 RepID=UPI00290A6C2A|nr:2-amino-4-hydroxy-6-hydroxymethyldihydropteridine diphosphokinase [Clostridium sp.]MDU5107895.1 2-amino-4-hydroxy-6-hydroxymethyldihydropteridine diphosphokinase [Clostridium sp.]